MKRMIVAFALLCLAAPAAAAAEPAPTAAWTQSALAADGELQAAREGLDQVFRFKIKDGQLIIPADQSLSVAFQMIQDQARKGSQGFAMGSGGGGGDGQWTAQATFDGDRLGAA